MYFLHVQYIVLIDKYVHNNFDKISSLNICPVSQYLFLNTIFSPLWQFKLLLNLRKLMMIKLDNDDTQKDKMT